MLQRRDQLEEVRGGGGIVRLRDITVIEWLVAVAILSVLVIAVFKIANGVNPFGPQIIEVNGCQYLKEYEQPMIHAGNCSNEVHLPK